jgi:hypothetical protein
MATRRIEEARTATKNRVPVKIAGIRFPETRFSDPRRDDMRFDVLENPGFELINEIEELEAKVAPDGGETVLPLPGGHKH